jgi:hypothetical protein
MLYSEILENVPANAAHLGLLGLTGLLGWGR